LVPPLRGGRQVSAKAQWARKFILRWIDSLGGWRYSQAQIPDLVANAIPRFRLRAQSFGSALPDARRVSAKEIGICVKRSSGAKARTDFAGFAQGLKPPSPSGLGVCAGAKARVRIPASSSRPKSCSDTRRGEQDISISTAGIAVPVSAASSRSRFTSISQRRTGGSRFL